jgi:hypothetical protein
MSSEIFWRHMLEPFFGSHPRLMAAFEDLATTTQETSSTAASTAQATDALQDATVIVLSSNQAFSNERLLRRGPGVTMVDTEHSLIIELDAKFKPLVDATLLGNYVDDATAAAGGVEIGEFYRNGSALMVRIA